VERRISSIGGRLGLPWRFVAVLLSVGWLLGGCGGGGGDAGGSLPPPIPGDETSTSAPAPAPVFNDARERAAAWVAAIVDATDPAVAVQATRLALAAGGVAQADGSRLQQSARMPTAGWTTDASLVFNLAAEARDRAVSARLTVDDLARMLADFGFPFRGIGTPGEQLLGFLRAWRVEALAAADDPSGFVPLLIGEFAARQQPPVDLADPAVSPADVRLTLLEAELLLAAFDRSFEPAAAAPPARTRERAHDAGVPDGVCAALKKTLGAVGGKLAEEGLKWVGGKITDGALAALGLSAAEIELFSTYGKVLGAIGPAVSVVKMAQIYASGQVVVKVEGANPVHKPAYNGPRRLVPVLATAGVGSEAWAEYQRSNGSQAYQDVKSCLGVLGLPEPLDLKDIAEKVDGWRVAWDLVSGSPQHALIPTDVNVFNASSAGHPFGMKLVRSGPVAAEARLQVDINREPVLATLLQGPLRTADVRVKAKVFTAEPPDATLLLQITNLLGTIGALVDLTTGWIQTLMPPTTTAVIKVQYHDLPVSLQASLALDMTFDNPRFRDSPAEERHTLSGQAQGVLRREDIRFSAANVAPHYGGTIDFTFGGLSTQWVGEDDGCTHVFSYQLRNGRFQMAVGPSYSLQNGQIVRNDGQPEQVGFTGADVPSEQWPAESKRHRIVCDGEVVSDDTAPMMPVVFIAAANALSLYDTGLMSLGPQTAVVSGWDLRNSRLLSDGTLELRRITPKTVTVLAQGVGPIDTVIHRIDTVIRLTPTFAPPPD
jgi:hypothetical protein